MYIELCMLSCFGRARLSATPWTVAHQAPLTMGFARQEYWSGLPCPSPGDLPDPRIEPSSLTSPAGAGRFFTTSAARARRVTSEQQIPRGQGAETLLHPHCLQVPTMRPGVCRYPGDPIGGRGRRKADLMRKVWGKNSPNKLKMWEMHGLQFRKNS